LKSVAAGYSLPGSRFCSVTGAPVAFEIMRIAARPACFQLSGLLSEAECDHLMRTAEATGMTATEGNRMDQRHGCDVAWLPHDTCKSEVGGVDPVTNAIADVCWHLLVPEPVQEPPAMGAWAAGCEFMEKLQVLRYEPGGEFGVHYDSYTGNHQRIITVLLYLNGVGETWFPLATTTDEEAAACPLEKDLDASGPAAFAAAKARRPGKDGLVARPRKGDAVAFYNFRPDGALDRRAIHAGLPAPAEKWCSALWLHGPLTLALEQLQKLQR
jgi:prolyl 4-hydroxylase